MASIFVHVFYWWLCLSELMDRVLQHHSWLVFHQEINSKLKPLTQTRIGCTSFTRCLEVPWNECSTNSWSNRSHRILLVRFVCFYVSIHVLWNKARSISNNDKIHKRSPYSLDKYFVIMECIGWIVSDLMQHHGRCHQWTQWGRSLQ